MERTPPLANPKPLYRVRGPPVPGGTAQRPINHFHRECAGHHVAIVEQVAAVLFDLVVDGVCGVCTQPHPVAPSPERGACVAPEPQPWREVDH